MAIALGVLVGLMLGLTGAGGSVIAVPLLIFALDLTLQQAAPVALLAACVAAAIGTVIGWDVRTVRYRAALLMAAAATATSWIGVGAADRLSNDSLVLSFSVVLVIVAVRMLLRLRSTQTPPQSATDPLCTLDPATGRLIWTPRTIALFSAVGALNGVLTGLLGVGGGFLIVPVLRSITPLSMHAAIATSLMTVALTTAAAIATHVAHDAKLPWLLALPFVAGAVLGMGGGRLLAPRLSGTALQAGFAVTLLICAASMAERALS